MTKAPLTIALQTVAIASIALLASAEPIATPASFRYRDYALGSSVAAVAKLANTRPDAVRTLHERPARIQEIEWRAPYVFSGTELADPVREILFSFVDDQLYSVSVSYDRNRMEGLTDADLIEGISSTYGVPILKHARIPRSDPAAGTHGDTTLVAGWDDAMAGLTLTRGTYSMQYQLVLVSKSLNSRAEDAIGQALRLDTKEAPERERERRAKDASEARAATQKVRVVNKAAFKP